MKQNNYTPHPIDTKDVVLPQELNALAEDIAKNVHEVWSAGRMKDGWTYGEERNDADMTYNRGEGIINWLNAHVAESWCVLDDDIFPDYEQLQIMEKLVKTCYMDGLTE